MVASEENMTGTPPGRSAELLQIVHQTLDNLGAPKDETAAVNKAEDELVRRSGFRLHVCKAQLVAAVV